MDSRQVSLFCFYPHNMAYVICDDSDADFSTQDHSRRWKHRDDHEAVSPSHTLNWNVLQHEFNTVKPCLLIPKYVFHTNAQSTYDPCIMREWF
jgi:hypothetical protein